MAKKSIIARDLKRQKLIVKFAAKRALLKSAGDQEGLSKLPPNSSPNLVCVLLAPSINIFPTLVLPVKLIFFNAGFSSMAPPINDASPTNKLITPLGMPACTNAFTMCMAERGVASDGLPPAEVQMGV